MATVYQGKTYHTAGEIRTALRLRHQRPEPAKVLAASKTEVERLLQAGRISVREAEELRNTINHCTQMDRGGGK